MRLMTYGCYDSPGPETRSTNRIGKSEAEEGPGTLRENPGLAN